MPGAPLIHILSEKRPKTGADPFFEFLKTAQGGPIQVDLSQVDHLDAMRLQTLVSGQRQWVQDGHAFEIIGMTEPLKGALCLLGIDPSLLTEGAAK